MYGYTWLLEEDKNIKVELRTADSATIGNINCVQKVTVNKDQISPSWKKKLYLNMGPKQLFLFSIWNQNLFYQPLECQRLASYIIAMVRSLMAGLMMECSRNSASLQARIRTT